MPGVYVSYPFCEQKCTFCNFASGISTAEMRQRYAGALRDEIAGEQWDWLPETLYIGGGTPSLMPAEEVAKLVGLIPFDRMREFTLECAPGTLDVCKVREWAALGVNRVSLGAQSFVNSELRRTGRKHTAEVVLRDMELLREHGITNINIDLIAGLAGQTYDSWDDSLGWVERLEPPHVSVYVFEVDDESRLGKEALLGGVRYGADVLPDDDATAGLYERAVKRLAAKGIERYEISNFAKSGFESHHNLKYWRREPYRGFGLDAHSFDGVRRWGNPEELEAYLAGETGPTTTADATEERFFVGLRLSEGIRPTTQEWMQFRDPIDRWLREGLLEREGDVLRLSNRGVLLSNEVLAEFVGVTDEDCVSAVD